MQPMPPREKAMQFGHPEGRVHEPQETDGSGRVFLGKAMHGVRHHSGDHTTCITHFVAQPKCCAAMRTGPVIENGTQSLTCE